MEIPPEAGPAALGAAGSAAALRWFPGGFAAKAGVWLTGSAVALVCVLVAQSFYGITGTTRLGIVAFFGGLFGVMFVDKCREFITSADVSQLWKALVSWIRKMLGVKDE